MGMGPVPASKLCLQKAGWTPADLDLMEINEAFAAQAFAVNKEMGWDTSKINVNGGAIALGHPIGASGCRVLVTLLHEMLRRDAKKGLASRCASAAAWASRWRSSGLDRAREQRLQSITRKWTKHGELTRHRVAFVTGGMGGLGEAICIKLAALGLHGRDHVFAGQHQGRRMAGVDEGAGARLQGVCRATSPTTIRRRHA